jgi:hypothetical protein
MFTRQAPALHQALLLGGLSPAMASQAQNLLGQCRQGLVHRGPIEIDRTTPDMRLIDPTTARMRFPQLDDVIPPDERPEEEEEEDGGDPPGGPPLFPPNITINNYYDNGGGGGGGPAVQAGEYIAVNNNAVSLRNRIFPQGRTCTFQKGEVRAVALDTRNISAALKGNQVANDHIELKWDENAPERTVLKYGIKNLKQYRIVTAVEFFPDGAPDEYGVPGEPGIRITYETIRAWPGDGAKSYSVIPIAECEDDSSGGSGRVLVSDTDKLDNPQAVAT